MEKRPPVDQAPPGRRPPSEGGTQLRLAEDACSQPVRAVVGQGHRFLDGVKHDEGTDGGKGLLGPEEGFLLLARGSRQSRSTAPAPTARTCEAGPPRGPSAPRTRRDAPRASAPRGARARPL